MYVRLILFCLAGTTIALLSWGCEELPNGVRACVPDGPEECPDGYVCMPVECPADYRCFKRWDGLRDYYAMGCVEDGVCDEVTCETFWSCSDCSAVCEPSRVSSTPAEYLVSHYEYWSDDGDSRPDIGGDLEGNGGIDNKWSQVANLINYYTHNDLDQEIAAQIASGHLLLTARVYDDYPGDHEDLNLVQLLLAEVEDASPVFDGSDVVRLSADASVDVGMCGRASDQRYGRPFTSDTLRFPVPWPGVGSTVLVDLHRPFVWGDVSANGWQEVHVGGGISPAQVYAELLPVLAELINRTIASDPGGQEARILADLFDAGCVLLDDVPGCEAVQPHVGECDDSADPPVITWTEVACNALLHSVLLPDFDSDGDGVDDLISFGARLTAVPVTIVE